jgi:lysozyme family protein
MANEQKLIVLNQHRWGAMHIKPSWMPALHKTAVSLCGDYAKQQFMAVQEATGVPWFVVGVTAEREYGGPPHWDKQLAQGDPLNRTSWHVPKGRGPFLDHPTDAPFHGAWYRAALDALIDCEPKAANWKDWTAGGTATILEKYNGVGYANMGRPSPYIWSASDQYVSGKYVSDHHYDPSIVDVQEGCMPIIAAMMAIDQTIKFKDAT